MQVLVFILIVIIALIARGCETSADKFKAREQAIGKQNAHRMGQANRDFNTAKEQIRSNFVENLGGKIAYARDNPDLDISAFLKSVANAVYPTGFSVHVSVDNFTEFHIKIKPLGRNKTKDTETESLFIAGLPKLVSACSPYLSSVELTESYRGKQVMILDKEGIDSIENWRTATQTQIKNALHSHEDPPKSAPQNMAPRRSELR